MFETLKAYFKGFTESIHPSFNAKNMYLMSHYENVVSDDTKRMQTFKNDLMNFVECKARMHHKTCTYDIPKDLRPYTQDIITWLEDMGFSVLDEGKYSPAFEGSIGISWRNWCNDKKKEDDQYSKAYLNVLTSERL